MQFKIDELIAGRIYSFVTSEQHFTAMFDRHVFDKGKLKGAFFNGLKTGQAIKIYVPKIVCDEANTLFQLEKDQEVND